MQALKTKRNLGIELLRLVSMLMIVILHSLEHGKVGSFYGLAEGLPLHWLKALCYSSVTLFGLITGYACIQSAHRWSRVIALWLEVLFYSLGIFIVGLFLGNRFSIPILVTNLMPVTRRLYWYISAYFLVFCMIPFLNKLLLSLSKRQFRRLILLGFVLLGLMGWLGDSLGFGPFVTDHGQSPIWLIYIYCVGAYIRIYAEDFSAWRKSVLFGIFLLSGALTVFSKKLIPGTILDHLFWTFIAPTTTLGAAALFIAFANLKIKKSFLIATFAPCTLGVYLLHDHPTVRQYVLIDGLRQCELGPMLESLGCVLAFSVALMIVCLLIDYLRSLLFKLLHIAQFSQWLERKIRALVRKILDHGIPENSYNNQR